MVKREAEIQGLDSKLREQRDKTEEVAVENSRLRKINS
jgi:hypothetical protein